MKNILIIYPHWPPSNLAGIHRARLISNFSTHSNWHSIVLTVKSQYYEEILDMDMLKTVSKDVEVFHVKALRVFKFRLFGDIGLRSFPFLLLKAFRIMKSREINFVWIPIPSFYVSLIGRILNVFFKIPYGIDYIDPWIRPIPPHESKFSRANLSLLLAKLLEPIAVKNASLISGVSELYFQPVIERNFKDRKIETVSMPYGFDPNDHEIEVSNVKYPWNSDSSAVFNIVYTGAFLPRSHFFLKALFKALSRLNLKKSANRDVRFYFIGTGNYGGKHIIDYAKDFDLLDFVVEINERKHFLDVLSIQSKSDAVLILGSTEKHYTASKTFQSILSRKPVISILHYESSANQVLKEVGADAFMIEFLPDMTEMELSIKIEEKLELLLNGDFVWVPEFDNLMKYSAKQSSIKLFNAIERIE